MGGIGAGTAATATGWGNKWHEISECLNRAKQQYRGSFWPVLLIFSVEVIGAINIATHLHR